MSRLGEFSRYSLALIVNRNGPTLQGSGFHFPRVDDFILVGDASIARINSVVVRIKTGGRRNYDRIVRLDFQIPLGRYITLRSILRNQKEQPLLSSPTAT